MRKVFGNGLLLGSRCLKRRRHRNLSPGADITVKGVLFKILANLNKDDPRSLIPLGHGDPSHFPCFRTTPHADDAVIQSIKSAKFNCYCPTISLPIARRAAAAYLSRDLPYQLNPTDVYLTLGCAQAIEVCLAALARPGANVLLPRPGFPSYEARCAFEGIEARHFDLLPDQNWQVDLHAVEALADENTVAMVIINPGNPCGNVFTYQHLQKVAETANQLGILVISDEVYGHLAFGDNPFVPMGVFGSIVPVLTLGSISKRWIVPGWRLGWLAVNDTNGILKQTGVTDSIEGYLNVICGPPTFMQGALPDILEKTSDVFFSRIVNVLKEDAEICYEKSKEISCIFCPHKPEGSMFVMVKLDTSKLDDIDDDMDFSLKLAKEESVITLPGMAVGMKNWLRITFAIDPPLLKEGLERIKAFTERHAKKQ
uniref:Aminotransferase class I/classII large domain-containing protein n=1 Tax=Kalanchoe fedtschenkoi TaxID=63787 RepID=A0A7N0ULS7_KALFE